MKQVVHKHPLAVRWFHWLNFPILAVMIWSGILIYWAYDIYRIGLGDTTLIKFFPGFFYEAFDIDHKLARGMAFHFLFMWLFFINGLLYVLFLIFSGQWRVILPNRRSWREGWQVLLHDLRLRKTAPPAKIYNGAQKIIYTGTMFLGLVMLLSGLSIYKPVQLEWLTLPFGGYEGARLVHFTGTILFMLFFLIHIIQVLRAGWDNFRSMVTGFSLKTSEPKRKPE